MGTTGWDLEEEEEEEDAVVVVAPTEKGIVSGQVWKKVNVFIKRLVKKRMCI